MQPNDVIVRLTKDADGKVSHEVLLGVSDEDMIPHLNEVAEKIDGVLNPDTPKVVLQD
jgi:hypothetical protein